MQMVDLAEAVRLARLSSCHAMFQNGGLVVHVLEQHCEGMSIQI